MDITYPVKDGVSDHTGSFSPLKESGSPYSRYENKARGATLIHEILRALSRIPTYSRHLTRDSRR